MTRTGVRGGRSGARRFPGGLSLLVAAGCVAVQPSATAPERAGDGKVVDLAGHGGTSAS